MTNVAIVAANDDVRLLLRGLVRLGRHRVVGESRDLGVLPSMPREGPDAAQVLLIDAELSEEGLPGQLKAMTAAIPGVRVVLVSPTRSPRIASLADAAGIDRVIHRPFAMHELMSALNSNENPAETTDGR